MVAVPAWALHDGETPPVIRITSGGPHATPPGRSWNSNFPFSSTVDLLGTGSAGRQIFMFRMLDWACQNGTAKATTPCPIPERPFLLQITNGAGSPDNPSVSDRLFPNTANEDGPWIAFDADGSFNPNVVGPSAARRQIFLLNLKTNELVQVTNYASGDSVRPEIAERSGIVVFQSNATELSGSTSGTTQVYAYLRGDRAIVPLSFGQGNSRKATLNAGGFFVAFESTSYMIDGDGREADGHDTGISQIFMARIDTQHHSARRYQLTRGNAPSRNPYHAATDKFVVFESSATDLPGTLGSPGTNIFKAPTDSGHYPLIQQLTTLASNGNCHVPSLSDNGDKLAMVCDGDPLRNGTTGNRLFRLEWKIGELQQLTGRGDILGTAHQWYENQHLFVATNTDLSGAGVCDYQLFVINNNEGYWNGAKLRGQLPPDSIPPPTTNVIGPKTLTLLPSGLNGGSQFQITRVDGDPDDGVDSSLVTAQLQVQSTVGVKIGPVGFDGEAPISVPKKSVVTRPFLIPNVGAVCIAAAADGSGLIDCDGGHAGSDTARMRDHDTDDEDPFCQAVGACREDDPTCARPLPHPHFPYRDCGACLPIPTTTTTSLVPPTTTSTTSTTFPIFPTTTFPPGFPTTSTSVTTSTSTTTLPPIKECDVGPYAGVRCQHDGDCRIGLEEQCADDGRYAICNGPDIVDSSGFLAAGGMQMALPVSISLSTNPRGDGLFCSPDDTYTLRDYATTLRLTTGTIAATIINPDLAENAAMTTSLTGVPFDCALLRTTAPAPARLVGLVFSELDMNLLPVTLGDVIMSVALDVQSAPFTAEDFCNPAPCADSAACDDGNPCNGVETCNNGTCTPGPSIQCDDGNTCNGVETCDPASGSCLPGTVLSCDDTNPCTDDTCNPSAGCINTPNTATCSDGNACTTGDVCSGGACTGIAVVCDDGDPCNGVETCNPTSGACQANPPPTCNDNNPCTDDSCQPGLGCVHLNNTLPCSDGNACTTADVCAGGSCTGVVTNCDDGNACNGSETCNPANGLCQPGTPPVCDDTNPCTTDTCIAAVGCVHLNNTNPCSDGNLCTSNDACSAGLCTGTPTVCDDTNACNGIETCNPSTGACVPGVAPNCNDNNGCTDDSCQPAIGCLHTNNTAPCTDGNACTQGDVCGGGNCNPGPALDCDDANACNGLESCDPANGTCVSGTPPNCNDNNPCTDDSCSPALGCQHAANTASCSDGNLCTTGDVCSAGICSGAPVDCDDGNVCNGDESCSPGTGACSPGTPLTCSDTDVCTTDSCNPVSGCEYTPVLNYLSCRGNDVLNQFDLLLGSLGTVTPDQTGGARRRQTLQRLMGNARQLLQQALVAPNPKVANKRLNRSIRALRTFVRNIARANAKGRFSPTLATTLTGDANALISGIETLRGLL